MIYVVENNKSALFIAYMGSESTCLCFYLNAGCRGSTEFSRLLVDKIRIVASQSISQSG